LILIEGTSIFRGGQDGAVFFCIHGAGQSAMSFALFAKEVKHFGTVISFDFKGHGLSKNNNNIDDLSIEALIDETMEIIRLQMYKYA
jgi:protein phosphatase methylesterase 1